MAAPDRAAVGENAQDHSREAASAPDRATPHAAHSLASQIGNRGFAQLVACPDVSDKYANDIGKALGVDPAEQRLDELDELGGSKWEQLKNAVVQAEGTIEGWIFSPSDEKLPAIIRDALSG